MNVFHTHFGQNLENCDLDDQISMSHECGHERIGCFCFFACVTIQKKTKMKNVLDFYSSKIHLIIMYIYHALINTLSTHIIHINLYTIFYTHIEDSPTKTIYIRHYMHTHTHTHTHTMTSRNWVLILVVAEILWEEEGFQFGFKRWQVEQCLRSCGSEFQMCGPKQKKVRKPLL